MSEGFDPNAVDNIIWDALKCAVYKEDAATAEVLLAAGADPFGDPKLGNASPVGYSVSEQLRALFVRFAIMPAHFKYAIGPEYIPLSFLTWLTSALEGRGQRNKEPCAKLQHRPMLL